MSCQPGATPLQLDRIYLRLLSLLQRQGRLSNQALSEAVGLSPRPCLERLRRLEAEGIVRGYHADVDVERLCQAITVMTTVRLRHHKPEDFQRFDAAVRGIPEIIDCAKVSGGFDYILRFACRSMGEYDALSDRLLSIGPPIDHISSHVVLAQTKPFAGWPLDRLLPGLNDANG